MTCAPKEASEFAPLLCTFCNNPLRKFCNAEVELCALAAEVPVTAVPPATPWMSALNEALRLAVAGLAVVPELNCWMSVCKEEDKLPEYCPALLAAPTVPVVAAVDAVDAVDAVEAVDAVDAVVAVPPAAAALVPAVPPNPSALSAWKSECRKL